MKVGTDGILLGAWADISGADTILDIGTGTGLIALMMAQRSDANITGIEIEKNAAEEALKNFTDSVWSNRLTILNISLQEFVKLNRPPFDLIVTNPPYFNKNQKSRCKYMAIARHNDLLPFPFLAGSVAELLTPKGKLTIILPAEPAWKFIEIAAGEGLSLSRLTEIKTKSRKKINRLMMEFTKNKTTCQKDHLVIHTDDSKDYTNEYKELTKEFYLNF